MSNLLLKHLQCGSRLQNRMAYEYYMTEMHGASVYTEEHLESSECTQ